MLCKRTLHKDILYSFHGRIGEVSNQMISISKDLCFFGFKQKEDKAVKRLVEKETEHFSQYSAFFASGLWPPVVFILLSGYQGLDRAWIILSQEHVREFTA